MDTQERIANIIAEELNIKLVQVVRTIELINEGNTIPFIARYRKEVTGGLSDETLRDLGERLTYLRNLEARKEEVKTSIENQGKLTDEIVANLENAKTLAEVEDIYRPYKQKKKTRATVAKAKGLEPLAEIILAQTEKTPIEEIAKQLDKRTFLRCHRSYIVNMRYVASVDDKDFILQSGSLVPIRQSEKQVIKQTYMDFLFSVTRGEQHVC